VITKNTTALKSVSDVTLVHENWYHLMAYLWFPSSIL